MLRLNSVGPSTVLCHYYKAIYNDAHTDASSVITAV